METLTMQLIWVVVITALLGFSILFLRLKLKLEIFDSILWFFLALSGASLIFAIFRDNSADGTLMGIKLGGPIAGFAFIWFTGYKFSKKDNNIDLLKKEFEQKLNELDKREKQITIEGHNETVKFSGFKSVVYAFPNLKNKQIGIAIGTIDEVKGIDIWVNSENVFMQMARFFDKSISGIIRFMGAEKSKDGLLCKDIIATELFEKAGHLSPVRPCQVFVTSAGQLETTNGVKKIIHVAAVEAEPIVGFRPVQDIGRCISNVLNETLEAEFSTIQAHSILIPLIGTGNVSGDKLVTVDIILKAIIVFLTNNPTASINKVYLLAYTNQDLATCEKAFTAQGGKIF